MAKAITSDPASRALETAFLSKPEWGTKRTCLSCGTKFYDLRKSPIVCPSCQAIFDPDSFAKPRRTRNAKAPKPEPAAARPVPASSDEESAKVDEEDLGDLPSDDDIDIDDDDNDSVLVDVGDDDDDDDLSDVVIDDKGDEDT